MADISEILKKPAFSNLEPELAELLVDMIQRLEGKSMIESIAIVSGFQKKLPKGREFSKEEQDAMLDAVIESMPPQDQEKFSQIAKLMQGLKK